MVAAVPVYSQSWRCFRASSMLLAFPRQQGASHQRHQPDAGPEQQPGSDEPIRRRTGVQRRGGSWTGVSHVELQQFRIHSTPSNPQSHRGTQRKPAGPARSTAPPPVGKYASRCNPGQRSRPHSESASSSGGAALASTTSALIKGGLHLDGSARACCKVLSDVFRFGLDVDVEAA